MEDWEKEVDEEIKENEVLREIFEEDPEKKEMYIEKMEDSDASGGGRYTEDDINPVYCRTCIFAHGRPPFEDGAEKFYCAIYRAGGKEGKPPEVYYDGERCDYYEKEARLKR